VFPDLANPGDNAKTILEDTALIAPPYLTPGTTWYVELVGKGLTDYTITSSPVALEHAAWAMPPGYNNEFGDSGEALPGDRGIDLGEDDWHFYAVDVPEGNGGLLRTELQAINGDPQLYVGERGMPGVGYDGRNSGSGGIRCDHQLNRTGTEYGNWVPGDGRTERQLRPGRWFLAVRANSSNVRYRLLLSTGDVQDLDLDGGALTGQNLKGEDWRYYRVAVPEDAPMTWTMNFTQQMGDVVMHLRDSVPPGQRGYNSSDYYNTWVLNAYDDFKNGADYSRPYSRNGYDVAGSHDFPLPPLRPGHTYFVGFRAANDAEFSLSSSVSAESLGVLPELDYATGLASFQPGSGRQGDLSRAGAGGCDALETHFDPGRRG